MAEEPGTPVVAANWKLSPSQMFAPVKSFVKALSVMSAVMYR